MRADFWNKCSLGTGPSGRAVSDAYYLRPLEHWDRGFESYSRHGCVSAFYCVVLYCGQAEAFRRACSPSKESYQLSK